MKGQRRTDTVERVMEIVHRRYPCQELPYGAISKIARELDVTPEYVRQIVKRYGMTGSYRTPTMYVCRHCQIPFRLKSGTTNLYCSSACRQADGALRLTCDNCGKEYALSGHKRSTFIANRKKFNVTRNYCSYACFGQSIAGQAPVPAGQRRRED